MRAARSYSADDKTLIDGLVAKRFGSAEDASVVLRQTIVRGFRAAATRAIRGTLVQEQPDLTDGNLPLSDPAVLAVWE